MRKSDVLSASFVGSLVLCWLINVFDLGIFTPLRSNLEFRLFSVQGPGLSVVHEFAFAVRSFSQWWLVVCEACLATWISQRTLRGNPLPRRTIFALFCGLVGISRIPEFLRIQLSTVAQKIALLGYFLQLSALVALLGLLTPPVARWCAEKVEEHL